VAAVIPYDQLVSYRPDDNEIVMQTGDLFQRKRVRFQTKQSYLINDALVLYEQRIKHAAVRI
jgi:hypothetical protein